MSPVTVKTMRFLYKLVKNNLKRRHFRYKIGQKAVIQVDKMLAKMYEMLGCTLTTILGVRVITAVKILSEIGNIKRFPNANKLAQFAGIAPLHLSSSGKGKDFATKQGNRRLQATNYEKRKAEGKTSRQALICISRRLISQCHLDKVFYDENSISYAVMH